MTSHTRNTSSKMMLTLSLVISVLTVQINAIISDPPSFNGALEKSVFVSPLDALCGISDESEFCESVEGEAGLNYCHSQTCDLRCKYDSLISSHDAFGYHGAAYTSCVHDTDFVEVESSEVGRAPQQGNSSVIRFEGSGGNDCSFQLYHGWMAHISLQMFPQFTVAFWIWPEGNGHQ